MSDTEKTVRFGDITTIEFEVEPSPRHKIPYICRIGEIVWQFVFFSIFAILLIYFILIEFEDEAPKLREKHLWVYVLCIWPATAIMVSAMYHKQQLFALFKFNAGEMELAGSYDERDEELIFQKSHQPKPAARTMSTELL
ncbi:hypothetical protein CEXT_313461 [Caerostris extrusa]|uniref:Uncharacterized protein n=1 Tax=Caerostris extrusa TaxID=172846 RepID=A0AAV4WAH6_CAEEX|nr:hypothetical protein CEXT_313461 [Caerostris extrusa]